MPDNVVSLESRDFQAASSLIGKLQATLQLGSMGFGVSPQTRREAQDTLAEAIGAFRARADIARMALGGKAYKIRRINLNTSGAFPQPRQVFAARALAIAEAVAPPQFEGGTSRVSVAASGAIEVE